MPWESVMVGAQSLARGSKTFKEPTPLCIMF